MGRKSVRENKTEYQLAREDAGLSRDAAAELLEFVSADRIERVETLKSAAHPEEVLAMERGYKAPGLCNHYCSHECPIGIKYVPEIEEKELTQITLEILQGLGSLEKDKERFIDVSADGEISRDELADFLKIRDKLMRLAGTIDSLSLWLEREKISGDFPEESE